MWVAKVFFAVLAIAWADRLSHAKEYQPEQREALLIRPEKPLQRVSPPQTCIDRPKPPTRVEWRIEDASGNVIEAGTIFIRRRC
jgi:hypothetical protein